MSRIAASQSVHLVVEVIGAVFNDGATPVKLQVPASGHTFLVAAPGETPRLQDTPPESMQHAVVIEPVKKAYSPLSLIVINPAAAQTRVNGAVAPRVAVLREKDNFQINDAFSFHLTLFNQPKVGPPRPESVGQKQCAVCTKTLEPTSTTLECVHCGAELHLEGEGGLDCATIVSDCPGCSQPLIRAAAYTFEPVF